MEMTAGMLQYLLRETPIHPVEPSYEFFGIQLLTGREIQHKKLYLSVDQSLQEKPEILQLSSSDLINPIFEAYQNYLQWREQCLRYSSIDHDLNTLMDISSEFLGWDIWIVSPDYRMEAGSTHHFPGHFQTSGHMPKSEVERLYNDNPRFDETFRLKGIQPYIQSWVPGAKLYYYNLFQENLYLGRVLILIPDDSDESGSLSFMDLVCEDIETCYRFLYLRRRHGDDSYRFYDLWKELLLKQTVNTERALAGLHRMGWQETDRFQMLYLVPAGYVQSQQTLKYYAVQLESTFHGCVAAELEDGLYCLRNLTVDSAPDFRQRLGEFLRENLFRVGISNPFRDFFDSPRYRKQACDALRIGMSRNPNSWRFEFCDYVGDYVLEQALSHYSALDLCPRNLRALLDYDEAHPESDLAQTLYQYYANQFNAQLAAQKLFIHRTTFFYRLNKIQKIAPFHPEDPAETCQILLAFSAMKGFMRNN